MLLMSETVSRNLTRIVVHLHHAADPLGHTDSLPKQSQTHDSPFKDFSTEAVLLYCTARETVLPIFTNKRLTRVSSQLSRFTVKVLIQIIESFMNDRSLVYPPSSADRDVHSNFLSHGVVFLFSLKKTNLTF